jgi:hypothetical protein
LKTHSSLDIPAKFFLHLSRRVDRPREGLIDIVHSGSPVRHGLGATQSHSQRRTETESTHCRPLNAENSIDQCGLSCAGLAATVSDGPQLPYPRDMPFPQREFEGCDALVMEHGGECGCAPRAFLAQNICVGHRTASLVEDIQRSEDSKGKWKVTQGSSESHIVA